MNKIVEFFTMDYAELSHHQAHDLYRLRHETFKSRLNWRVNSHNGLEYDEYDTENTVYLFGMTAGEIICSARFINTQHRNMTREIFSDFFGGITLPDDGSYIEVTRLFIDKNKRNALGLSAYPLSKMIFISMINYCIANDFKGMYAVVSQTMYLIFQRSGWKIILLQEGVSEKKEKIYFIYMPADRASVNDMVSKGKKDPVLTSASLDHWPLAFLC